MKFNFEGFDAHGAVIKDVIEAENDGKAAELLRDRGVFAQKIEAASGEPMKSVLPGGRPLPASQKQQSGVLPWQASPEVAAPVPGTGSTGVADAKTVVIPKPGWKAELKRDLAAIKKVMEHCDDSKKDFAGIPATAVKAGKELAGKELVAKAIAKAVQKALAEG